MKYRPLLPQRNDNVSHQHPLREFLLILRWAQRPLPNPDRHRTGA
ncbi:MAG TPA: hypothetical protein VIG66_05335 [Noviherbaspirillum sp.]